MAFQNFREFWVRCTSCCILQICHFPPIYFHTDWMYRHYYYKVQKWRLTHGGCRPGMYTMIITVLFKQERNTDKVMQGDTNTMSVFRRGWHFEMTGLLFTKRNVDTGLSSAAFLTVWKVAREGWWQADGLPMVSAPSNLLTHTTRYRTCLYDCSSHFICTR